MNYYGNVEYDSVTCPACKEGILKETSGGTTTLIGWFGGPDENPNHWTKGYKCNKCQIDLVKHWVIKDKNAWFSIGKYCVAGKPSCCESSYLTSCECGGWKKHSEIGKFSGESNIANHWVPHNPQFWQCQSCNKKYPDHHFGTKFMDEESIDLFIKWAKENPKPDPSFKLKGGWTVEEKIGLSAINSNAINKLRIKD